jgi:general nucleoside transport system ATP-binding protein
MTMEKTPEALENNSAELVIQTKGLTKRFLNVVANDNVSVDVRKGEIHCFLGENGAGKTTLAECLYGYYQPEGGQILFKGKPVKITSPNVAINLGIGMVHQHFVLIEPLTVIENIVLGTEPMGIIPNFAEAEAKVQALCDTYGVEINLKACIWQLSVGQQQWVEILKALYVGIDLLILDEPTAVLTPQESERLFEVLQQMKENGLSIIFITHKLKEVMLVSDRVTILRKGKLVDTVNTTDMTREDLACMMVGREVVFRVAKDDVERGEPILKINDLHVKNDWNQGAVCGIDLILHKNEIVGVAGVGGNGQRELFEALVGIRKVEQGDIKMNGDSITHLSPRQIMAKGIGHVPEDRIRMGLIPDFSVAENLILGQHRDPPARKGLNIDSQYVKRFAEECVSDFDIATPSIEQQTQFLSGGNQQKVILARELNQKPRVFLTNQPTRGLDVGVIEYVHGQLLEMRKECVGILLFSEDLDEIMNLSDRIVVLFKGQIMGIFDSQEARVDEIGLLMAGVTEDDQ